MKKKKKKKNHLYLNLFYHAIRLEEKTERICLIRNIIVFVCFRTIALGSAGPLSFLSIIKFPTILVLIEKKYFV